MANYLVIGSNGYLGNNLCQRLIQESANHVIELHHDQDFDNFVEQYSNVKLVAYKHPGFGKAMDTLKDKNDLNEIWDSNTAPWKMWD